MSYENPPPPDDVNVGRENVVVEFLRLAAGLALVVMLASAVLMVAGGWLARLIPFGMERAWAGEDRVIGMRAEPPAGEAALAIQGYLQTLAGALARHMDLPPGMAVQLHYSGQADPNAFAGLGGHVVVTRGLYQRMPSENALALVLAHEIAHVRARDPIAGVGGGSAALLVLALFTGNANPLTGAFSALIQRGYSRQVEARADTAAIDAVRRQYGHAGGGAAVFETLQQYHAGHGGPGPSLLSTHPLDAQRIARLQGAAAGWDADAQPLRPLAVPPEPAAP